MVYEIRNIDLIIKEFTTDNDFINYAQMIFDENEETDTYLKRPNSVEGAEHYINTYCIDLDLTIA